MDTIKTFLADHPEVTHALVGMVVFYVLANLAVWPPPQDPRYRFLWTFFVRTLVRGWDVYGGVWKLPGTVVPEPPPLDAPSGPADRDRVTSPGEAADEVPATPRNDRRA